MLFQQFNCWLFISRFFQFAFYLSLSLSVISTGLAQPCCECCNLSVSVILNVRFTTNVMYMKNNTGINVSNKQKYNEHDVWSLCWLLLECEALRQRWAEPLFSDSDSPPAFDFKTPALTLKNFETSTPTPVNTPKTSK